MKPSKFLSDPEFMAAVGRIESGKCSRAQAAEQLGTTLPILNVRLARAGLLDRLKARRNYSGKHLFTPDKAKVDNYLAAVDEALTEGNVRKVWQRYPDLSYVNLCLKVRLAKKRQEPAAQQAGSAQLQEGNDQSVANLQDFTS